MPSSGFGGPCDHCGRTQSCCWRRGPPSKPTLCNACGSRYLVKKNLDGYRPIAARTGSPKQAAKGKPRPAGNNNAGPKSKPKRAVIKRLDSGTWVSEAFDSEDSDAYMTDDSGGPSSSSLTAQGDAPRGRAPQRVSLLGDASRAGKVYHITSQAQLKALGLDAFNLNNSLRLKPRKPLNPTITAVF